MFTSLASVTINIEDQLKAADSAVKIFDLGYFISILANTILIVAAVATFLYFVYGGFMWIIAQGDKGKIESARNIITQAIIGLTVTAAAFALFSIVQYFFGISILGGMGSRSSSSSSSSSSQSSTRSASDEKNEDEEEARQNLPAGACGHWPNEGYTLSGGYACYDAGVANCVMCYEGRFYKRGATGLPRGVTFDVSQCTEPCAPGNN